MTGAPSAFVDKDSIMKRTALRSFIQSMQQNNVVEIVCNTASPGFYSYLFLVPKKLGGWRPVIDLSFLNFFQVIPTLDRCHKIKALIRPFLHSQGGCAHMWQILLSLCGHRETGSSRTAAHPRSPTLHLSTLGFQCFNQKLWIPLSPMAQEELQWLVDVSTQCSDGSPSYPDRTRHSVVHGCIKHRLGSTVYGQQLRKHITSTCSSWKPDTKPYSTGCRSLGRKKYIILFHIRLYMN